MTFHVLSFVDPTAVPLCFVAGPALEVFTESSHTEDWLNDNLLGDALEGNEDVELEVPWWNQNYGQSNVGVLLCVTGEMKLSLNGPRVTELLLYASVSRKSNSGLTGILTPPRSSSPSASIDRPVDPPYHTVQTSHVYALPLSSELVHGLDDFLESQSPPPEDLVDGHAQFLTPMTGSRPQNRSGNQKRQRLNSLFEDAAQQNKRSRRRGGESVAMAMASLDKTTSDNQRSRDNIASGCADNSTDFAAFVPNKPMHPRMLGMSRSQSLGSMRDLEATRPSSRGSVGAMKRSSLHRVASVATFDSSSPAPEYINGFEQQNKASLSRVVMAGMRMYGLQQQKKAINSRAVPEVPPDTITKSNLPAATTETEDEYKLIYHQAYKAASFALRKQMAVSDIGQEIMREIVDQLLELFCNDRLLKAQQKGTSQQGFGSLSFTEHTDFDLPSGNVCGDVPSACLVTPRKNAVHIMYQS